MSKNAKAIVWIVVAIVVVGGTYLYSTRTQQASGEPVTIGFTGPLSGDLANLGMNARAAVEIAVDEVNAAGGIKGQPLKVIYEDDQCNAANGSKAGSKLINSDGVQVILGGACSPSTLAIGPLANQAKVAELAYCSTAPTVTGAGDYVFRDVPSDLFQGDFAAKYAYTTLGKRKAAIVYINHDWGVGLRKAFGDAFKKLGGEVVLEEGYAPASKDLRSQMTKVKASGADLLYFPGFTDGSIAGLKQAKELGLNISILGADAWDDGKLWSELGAAGEGSMFTLVGTNSSDSFKAKMKEKLKSDEIIYCSNYAYDGLKILAQAMNAAGTNGEAVKNQLYKTKYTGGVASETIEFDANGDPTTYNYIVKVVRGGKSELMK